MIAVVELVAGYVAFQVCRQFWMLHLHSIHAHRHTTDYMCVSDLKVCAHTRVHAHVHDAQVSVMYGMLAEAAAAGIVQIVDDAGYRHLHKRMHAHIFGSVVVALTVVLGVCVPAHR